MTDPRFCAYCRQREHLPFGMPCSVCHDTSGFQPEVDQAGLSTEGFAMLILLVVVIVALCV